MKSNHITQPNPCADAGSHPLVNRIRPPGWRLAASGLALWLTSTAVLANGGPFVIKYPGGDPAAKGVLARLDPELTPARESRLEVIREDLAIRFAPDRIRAHATKEVQTPALVAVTATYLITNPTPETVEVDFGFPILRGIYINPWSMMRLAPEVQVRVDNTGTRPAVISTSAIYGLLRRRAAAAIERAIQADVRLQQLFEAVQSASGDARASARENLAEYLTGTLKWSAGEAALLAEYAALEPAESAQRGKATQKGPADLVHFGHYWLSDESLRDAAKESAWATTRIGEQKATQWLTVLAARLDPASAGSYEAIFQAWGGDVRERSVDLNSGKIRPREITLKEGSEMGPRVDFVAREADPTVYARVDYLDAAKNLTAEQQASWKAVLKHLPVVFTFAPMNLLHYQVSFPPGAGRSVAVSYKQYAYQDTRPPESYQIAYVVHPASLWDRFGPIHLTVTTPAGVTPVSTMNLVPLAGPAQSDPGGPPAAPGLAFHSYGTTLTDKTGELFIGINAEEWRKAISMTGVSALLEVGPPQTVAGTALTP